MPDRARGFRAFVVTALLSLTTLSLAPIRAAVLRAATNTLTYRFAVLPLPFASAGWDSLDAPPSIAMAIEGQGVRHDNSQGGTRQNGTSLEAEGEAVYRSGHLDEARRLLEQAVRLNPRSAHAHAFLGLVLARQNASQPALRHLGEAHKLEPHNPDYAYDYAVLLLQDQQFAAATPILETLYHQSPKAEDILVNLARAYAGAHKFRNLSAIAAALPSAEYSNEPLLKTLATILASSGQFAAVEGLWKAAIDHERGLTLPYAALAELWIARGEPRQALALLAGAPPAVRGPLYLYVEGETRMALGDYSEAAQSFGTLTRQLPANQSAWSKLVKSYLLAGQLKEAQQAAGQASERFPNVTEFPYQQAIASYMLGRSSDAIEELKPVLERDQGRDLRPLLLMAVLESQTGNYPAATRYYAHLEQIGPGCNALASYFYGTTLLRLHQLRPAQLQLQTAARCRPHFALAEFRLGQTLSQEGNLQAACATLWQAIHDDPTLAEPYYALAQVRRRLGDARGAQTALRQFGSLHKHVSHSDRELLRQSVVTD